MSEILNDDLTKYYGSTRRPKKCHDAVLINVMVQ
jgi:hypothetical protein